MRCALFWIPPLGVTIAMAWWSHACGAPNGETSRRLLIAVTHAFMCGILGLALDWALRCVRHDLPLYRRHLWIFLLGIVLGVAIRSAHADLLLTGFATALGLLVGLALACLPQLWGRRLGALSWWRGVRERPDATRSLILVADPHWSEELTGLREATLANPDADWLFLGDVFDVWVALPGMQTEAQRSFLWWVQERRAAGRWVGLWMGNREFFLDSLASRFDLLGEGIGGELPGDGLVFEHGDLVNDQDRGYRIWNLISRSGFFWLVAWLLPGSAASALARKLERSLRTTNQKYKIAFPREAFARVAETHEGKTFLTGHFHTHEVEGNGVALPWAHDGAFVRWCQGRLEILSPPEPKDSTFPVLPRP